jgi:type IV secretion system protein VirB9
MKLPHLITLPIVSLIFASSTALADQQKIVPDIEPAKINAVINTPAEPKAAAVIATKAWQRSGIAMPIKANDGRIKYPYGESTPTVICSPLHICDIELEAGEKIQNVAIGDQVRWLASPASSGSGNLTAPHIIVKPTDENISTNMVITTDKRTYYLYLTSKKTGYVTRLSFYYPHDLVQTWADNSRNKQEAELSKIAEFPSITVAHLDFNYDVSGSSRIKPIRVFNDGKHVYLQMNPTLATSEAPILMVINKSGEAQLVNYRLKNGYYVVDRLFDKAELILGVGKSQEKVKITHKTTQTCFFNCK